jgi:hypothetical protein
MSEITWVFNLFSCSMFILVVATMAYPLLGELVNAIEGKHETIVYTDEINLMTYTLRDDIANKCGRTSCAPFDSICTQKKWSKECLDCGLLAHKENSTKWYWSTNAFEYGCHLNATR